MKSLTSTSFLTFFTILLISTSITVLAQTEAGRNITIPTTTTTSAPTTATPSTTNNSTATTTTGNNSTTANRNTTTTNNNSTSTQNSTSSTPTKLTPVADATGAPGNVPAPAATGGKPNGRFGPDDQYIASGFHKLAIPLLSSLLIMSSTVAVLTYGAMS